MLGPDIKDLLCGHGITPEQCPHEHCGYRLAIQEITQLKAQLQLADPCGIAKDVLAGNVDMKGCVMPESQPGFIVRGGAAKVTLTHDESNEKYVVIVPEDWLYAPNGPTHIFEGLAQYEWSHLREDDDPVRTFEDKRDSLKIIGLEILDVDYLISGLQSAG